MRSPGSAPAALLASDGHLSAVATGTANQHPCPAIRSLLSPRKENLGRTVAVGLNPRSWYLS
jgi:hypothetical protein